MDIEFIDPGEAPRPPDQVAFRAVEVDPYPDGRRLQVRLSVTPFQVRPSIDLELSDAEGVKVASSSIIEATDIEMSVTMHLRRPAGGTSYSLQTSLHYPDHGEVDRRTLEFDFPQSGST